MLWPAASVYLSGGDASKTDARSLSAPNRAIPIPDTDRGTGKCGSGGDDFQRSGKDSQHQAASDAAVLMRARAMASILSAQASLANQSDGIPLKP